MTPARCTSGTGSPTSDRPHRPDSASIGNDSSRSAGIVISTPSNGTTRWSWDTCLLGRTTLVPSGHSIRWNLPFEWCRIRMACRSPEDLPPGLSPGDRHAETYTDDPCRFRFTADAWGGSSEPQLQAPPTLRYSQSWLRRSSCPTRFAGLRSPVIRQIASPAVAFTAAQSPPSSPKRAVRAGSACFPSAPSSSTAAPCSGASSLFKALVRTSRTAPAWAGSILATAEAASTRRRGC